VKFVDIAELASLLGGFSVTGCDCNCDAVVCPKGEIGLVLYTIYNDREDERENEEIRIKKTKNNSSNQKFPNSSSPRQADLKGNAGSNPGFRK
jgi:hypothetical protein